MTDKLREAKALYELKKDKFDLVKASYRKCQDRLTPRKEKYAKSLKIAGDEVCAAPFCE